MTWWFFASWPVITLLLCVLAARGGRWYRSSDRQTELDRMVKDQRRREARERRASDRKARRMGL